MKNEVFYERAQKLRDNYIDKNLYLYHSVLCDIISEFFGNGDEFPAELIISGHHYSKEVVKNVLLSLGIKFDHLSQNGDFFLIYSPSVE